MAIAWIYLPELVGSPQIQYPQFSLQTWTLLGVLLGLCFVGLLDSSLQLLEGRRSRGLLTLRVVTLALVTATVVGCAALVALESAGGWQDGLGTLRNFAFSFGAIMCLGRAWGAAAGVVLIVSYTGLCLFVGVDANGRIADWALLLSPSTDMFQGFLAFIALLLGYISYCIDSLFPTVNRLFAVDGVETERL